MGFRETAQRKPCVNRASIEESPSFNIRPPSRRAASTKVTSFRSDKACNGVLVRERWIVHTSRLGASKSSIEGGAAVRFQIVYIVRRYRPSSVAFL